MAVITTVLTLLGIFFLIGVCVLCIYTETKLSRQRYDERQIMERHKGYRFGFWVGVFGQALSLIVMLLCCGDGQADPALLAVIGITALLLPILGYFTYCAIKDVLLARSEHPAVSGIAFLLMAGAQFFSAFADMQLNGVKPYCIVLGIGLAYIAVLYFLQLLRKDRE